MHIACQNNWVMGVRALAGAGADVNARTEKHGLTPAMVSVQMGYWQSLKELIYAGANLRLLQVRGAPQPSLLSAVYSHVPVPPVVGRRIVVGAAADAAHAAGPLFHLRQQGS